MDYKTIRAHAKALPLEDRKTLIEILEVSMLIDDPSGPEFDAADLVAWRTRSKELARLPKQGLTREQVKASLHLPRA